MDYDDIIAKQRWLYEFKCIRLLNGVPVTSHEMKKQCEAIASDHYAFVNTGRRRHTDAGNVIESKKDKGYLIENHINPKLVELKEGYWRNKDYIEGYKDEEEDS